MAEAAIWMLSVLMYVISPSPAQHYQADANAPAISLMTEAIHIRQQQTMQEQGCSAAVHMSHVVPMRLDEEREAESAPVKECTCLLVHILVGGLFSPCNADCREALNK